MQTIEYEDGTKKEKRYKSNQLKELVSDFEEAVTDPKVKRITTVKLTIPKKRRK